MLLSASPKALALGLFVRQITRDVLALKLTAAGVREGAGVALRHVRVRFAAVPFVMDGATSERVAQLRRKGRPEKIFIGAGQRQGELSANQACVRATGPIDANHIFEVGRR